MPKKTVYERLEEHPELLSRIEAILDIAEGKDENRDTADEVEERAIEELRKLGQELMKDWATNKSTSSNAKHKSSNPKSKTLKKK